MPRPTLIHQDDTPSTLKVRYEALNRDQLRIRIDKLKRLKTLSKLSVVEEATLWQSQYELMQSEALTLLLKHVSSESDSLFSIASRAIESLVSEEEEDNYSEASKLYLAHQIVALLLNTQEDPLTISELFIENNPYLFAAFILEMALRGETNRLIQKGVLSAFYKMNMGWTDTISKVYALLQEELNYISEEEQTKIHRLVTLASCYTVNERGFESYPLTAGEGEGNDAEEIDVEQSEDGTDIVIWPEDDWVMVNKAEANEHGLWIAPDVLLASFETSFSKENLNTLYDFFGDRFLFLLLQHHYWTVNEQQPQWLKSVIESLETTAVISLFHQLASLEEYASEYLLLELLGLITEEQLDTLFEAGFHWQVLLLKPGLWEAALRDKQQCLAEQEITQYNWEACVKVLTYGAIQLVASDKQTIYQRLLSLLYSNSHIIDSFHIHNAFTLSIELFGVPLTPYSRNEFAGEFYEFCHQTQKTLCKEFEAVYRRNVNVWPYSETDFFALKDKYFPTLKKFAAIRDIGVKDEMYRMPKDVYALEAILLQDRYREHTDVEIEAMLQIFHPLSDYGNYPEPEKEQQKACIHTLSELIASSQETDLLKKAIRHLEMEIAPQKWWQSSYKDSLLSFELYREHPAVLVELLLDGADTQAEQNARLEAFENECGMPGFIWETEEPIEDTPDVLRKILTIYPKHKLKERLKRVTDQAGYEHYIHVLIRNNRDNLSFVLGLLDPQDHIEILLDALPALVKAEMLIIDSPLIESDYECCQWPPRYSLQELTELTKSLSPEEKLRLLKEIVPTPNGKALGEYYFTEKDFLPYLQSFLSKEALSEWILSSGVLYSQDMPLNLFEAYINCVPKEQLIQYILIPENVFWIQCFESLEDEDRFKNKLQLIFDQFESAIQLKMIEGLIKQVFIQSYASKSGGWHIREKIFISLQSLIDKQTKTRIMPDRLLLLEEALLHQDDLDVRYDVLETYRHVMTLSEIADMLTNINPGKAGQLLTTHIIEGALLIDIIFSDLHQEKFNKLRQSCLMLIGRDTRIRLFKGELHQQREDEKSFLDMSTLSLNVFRATLSDISVEEQKAILETKLPSGQHVVSLYQKDAELLPWLRTLYKEQDIITLLDEAKCFLLTMQPKNVRLNWYKSLGQETLLSYLETHPSIWETLSAASIGDLMDCFDEPHRLRLLEQFCWLDHTKLSTELSKDQASLLLRKTFKTDEERDAFLLRETASAKPFIINIVDKCERQSCISLLKALLNDSFPATRARILKCPYSDATTLFTHLTSDDMFALDDLLVGLNPKEFYPEGSDAGAKVEFISLLRIGVNSYLERRKIEQGTPYGFFSSFGRQMLGVDTDRKKRLQEIQLTIKRQPTLEEMIKTFSDYLNEREYLSNSGEVETLLKPFEGSSYFMKAIEKTRQRKKTELIALDFDGCLFQGTSERHVTWGEDSQISSVVP